LIDIKTAASEFQQSFNLLYNEVKKVIVGQNEVIEPVIIAMLAGGHILLEGVPGLGKTLLVRTLADAVGLKFARIQFTPDLMPADITGTTLIEEAEHGRRSFRFQPGPIFAGLVLADEVNRATPKTQSAMLEAMQEKSVTVSGETHLLPSPFFVMATQNPIEQEGTYPLPEAQLDRFMFKLMVMRPTFHEMDEILNRTTGGEHLVAQTVLDGAEILVMRDLAKLVPAAPEVRELAIRLTMATHPDDETAPEDIKRFVRCGASPRAAQAMVSAAKVRALAQGRYNAAREDIVVCANAALRHRILLNFEGMAENITTDILIDRVVKSCINR
jgi:MoxR-like ATPase